MGVLWEAGVWEVALECFFVVLVEEWR